MSFIGVVGTADSLPGRVVPGFGVTVPEVPSVPDVPGASSPSFAPRTYSSSAVSGMGTSAWRVTAVGASLSTASRP